MHPNKNKIRSNKKKNQGIALIEMLIVIGIIGLVTAGIVALSTSVFRGMDESDVMSNLSTVKAKLQKGYKTQGDYNGVDNDSPLLDRTDVLNPFGADFVVQPVLTSGQADGGVGIRVGGIGQESCRNLLTTIDSAAFDFLAIETGDAGAAPAAFEATDDIANAVAGTAVVYVQGGQEVTARTVDEVVDDCATSAANDNAMLIVGFY
ncbi:type II secretion system protein [Vibrio sp. RE86]|uniref:type II secretion system protein n=1 Tax=Vibrio sp. RE86 TaxID=2607605 RepID=UPI00149396B6|nr:type II secretion system protein [Vibrio sp. RE86]NOH79332.1 type II secretion system protein [Vibrio sp. RE86]